MKNKESDVSDGVEPEELVGKGVGKTGGGRVRRELQELERRLLG